MKIQDFFIVFMNKGKINKLVAQEWVVRGFFISIGAIPTVIMLKLFFELVGFIFGVLR